MAEDMEKSEENQPDIPKGAFLGFVLLDKKHWNREQFLRNLKREWKIDLPEVEGEEKSDILYAEIGEFKIAVTFLDAPVPDGEATEIARMNYLWPDAVKVAEEHRAQLMVAVLGSEDLIERGKLFVKVAASALKQRNATAIYTDGMVVSPEFYREAAKVMKDGQLPIFNWVWFGPYHDEMRSGAYTLGLRKFDRMEMEFYLPGEELPWEKFTPLRYFLMEIAGYLLKQDIRFDGSETVGLTEEMRLPMKRSIGLAIDDETLKILCSQENFEKLAASLQGE